MQGLRTRKNAPLADDVWDLSFYRARKSTGLSSGELFKLTSSN
jgi:hypothetical protein